MYYLGAMKKKSKKQSNKLKKEEPPPPPPPVKRPSPLDSLSRYISAPLVFTAIGLTVAFFVYTGLAKSDGGASKK